MTKRIEHEWQLINGKDKETLDTYGRKVKMQFYKAQRIFNFTHLKRCRSQGIKNVLASNQKQLWKDDTLELS